MDTAIANNKELSTSMLGHRDYYSSMDNFFSSSKPARQRRSKGFMRSKLHEITEQACIQWALQEQQQESRPLTEAAVLILKLFWREQQQQDNNNTNNSNDDNKKLNAAAKAVSTILWEEGEKDNEETFLKRIMERMEIRYTNNTPDGIDYVIPGNDDAIRAIQLYVEAIASAVQDGKRSSGKMDDSELAAMDAQSAPAVADAPAAAEPAVAAEPAAAVAEAPAAEAPAPASEVPAADAAVPPAADSATPAS
ncbi:MAG: hypothetical protein SGARI_000332 [Bacillariaceae sp.]